MAKKTKEVTEEVETTDTTGEIVVNAPFVIEKKEIPLTIVLPKDASEAQIEYAKVLNAYSVINPVKWELKKDAEIAKLKALKNAPAPKKDSISYTNKLSV